MDIGGKNLGKTIGFIGAGKMGAALIQGVISSGLAEPKEIIASDIVEERKRLVSRHGIRVTASNGEVARESQVIFVCVKPKDVAQVLEEMGPYLTPGHIIISIAAGIRISYIESRVPRGVRVVRVMPNLACQVGEVAAAYAQGSRATAEDALLTQVVFGALGVCLQVREEQLDAVTGLSGSGPAYVYLLLQGLIDGGVKAGLPPSTARLLAIQTLRGAAKLANSDRQELEDLIQQVATPGGTTVEGLKVLREGRVRESLAQAVLAATQRSMELAKG
jgi:pyrroline-5-carboxylate reductase